MSIHKKHMSGAEIAAVATIIAQMCLSNALCEDTTTFKALTCQVEYIDYVTVALSDALYVSEDEMWYGGRLTEGSYLFTTDDTGKILYQTEIVGIPGLQDPTIQCMTKSQDKLYLGLFDAGIQAGAVAVLSNGAFSFYQLPEGEKVSLDSMSACDQGISFLSISYGEGFSDIYFSRYENEELVLRVHIGTTTHVNSLLDTGICYSNGSKHYMIQYGRIAGRLQRDSYLLCLNNEGVVEWKIPLPNKTYINRITACQDHVYLSGLSGNLNEYDELVDHKALLLCYSQDGSKQWEYSREEFSEFHLEAVNERGVYCSTNSYPSGNYSLIQLSSAGECLNMVYLPESSCLYVKGLWQEENGSIVLLGSLTRPTKEGDLPFILKTSLSRK